MPIAPRGFMPARRLQDEPNDGCANASSDTANVNSEADPVNQTAHIGATLNGNALNGIIRPSGPPGVAGSQDLPPPVSSSPTRHVDEHRPRITENEDNGSAPTPSVPPATRVPAKASSKGKGKGKGKNSGRHHGGFAKGMFIDSNACSHVVYCDPKGNPKGILSEVKGKGKKHGKSPAYDCLFVGVMKSYDYSRNSGFVECDETRKLYRSDVYIHGSQVPFSNGAPFTKPFGFRVHVNQRGLPQVQKHSVVDLSFALAALRLGCTFTAFDCSGTGECQVTNLAFQHCYNSGVFGDSRDFHDAEIGSVVSIGMEWSTGWPRVARHSVSRMCV